MFKKQLKLISCNNIGRLDIKLECRYYRIFMTIILSIIFISNYGHTQGYDEFDEEFLYFTLDEITVTAAKHEQTTFDAPAIVTVITSEQIKNRGYRSIVDLLKDVVGIDVIDNVGRVEVGMRGINNKSDYGKHFQFLLDGHDMCWKQFTRNRLSAAIVAIDDIKRVEIVKGPGSALWGANATLGVINVITKSAEDIQGSEIVLGGGSYKTRFEHVAVGKQMSNDINIFVSANQYKNNTSSARRLKEYSEILGYDVYAENQKEEDYTFYTKLTYRDITISGYASRFDVYWPLATWALLGDDTRLVLDKYFVKLGYNHTFNEKLQLEYSVAYDHYEFGPGTQYEKNPGYEGNAEADTTSSKRYVRKMVAEDQTVESRLQVLYEFSNKLRIISGFDYDYLDAILWYHPYLEPGPYDYGILDSSLVNNPPTATSHNWALFIQSELYLIDKFGITAGIRHDEHSEYGGVSNPRLGIVFNPNKIVYFKILYGQAFKGPSLHEMNYVKVNSSYGNPELDPEKIKTYEFAMGFKRGERFNINFNLFQNTLEDIIVYQVREPEDIVGDWGDKAPTVASNQYTNVGKVRVRGIEMELKAKPKKYITLSLYGTYRDPVNLEEDGIRLENTSELSCGGTIDIKFRDRLNLNLNTRYVGDRISIREKNRSNPPYPTLLMDLDRKTDPYFVANITFRAFDFPVKGMEFSTSINNIFDKEYFDPGRTEDYPQLRRNIIASLLINVD